MHLISVKVERDIERERVSTDYGSLQPCQIGTRERDRDKYVILRMEIDRIL